MSAHRGVRRCGLGLLLLCSACSAYPHCIASGVPGAVGRWRYAGALSNPAHSPAAAELGRPEEIELRADGTFSARYGGVQSTTTGAGGGLAVPSGELTGHWSCGRFCVEAMFAPWAEIGTEPRLPSTASIQLSNGTLIVLGSNSGVGDVAYAPAAPR